mgnify:FL=1
MNKKWFIIVFSAILLLSSMVVQAKELNIWLVASTEKAKIIKTLTEQHFTAKTGITANFSTMTWEDAMSKIFLAMASGDVPDLAQMGSTWQGEFGLRGGIVDLAKAFPAETKALMANMYPGSLRPIEFRGTTWGIPAEIGNMQAYVRTDIFNENGWQVPNTWDELYKILPKMQAKNMNFGINYGANGISWFVASAFLRQAGGDVYLPGGEKSILDTPESIDGFKRFTELFTKHKVPKQIQQVEDFRRGAIPLMCISTNVVYGAYTYASPELQGKWTTALIPGTVRKDGTINHSGYLGTNNFAIFEKSKLQKEAFEWIKWFMSEEIQVVYSKEYQTKLQGAFNVSPNIKAMARMDIKPEHRTVLMKQLEQDIGIPFALGGETVWRYVDNATASVVLNGMDSEKAIRQAAKEVTDEMNRKAKEFKRFLDKLPLK